MIDKNAFKLLSADRPRNLEECGASEKQRVPDLKTEPRPDPNFCRAIDFQSWSNHLAIDELVSRIIDRSFRERRYWRRGDTREAVRRHLKVLILNLLSISADDPSLSLEVPRGSSSYRLPGRYNRLRITRRLVEVIDQLRKDGLVGMERGFSNPATGTACKSRVWPAGALIAMLEPFSSDVIEFQSEDHGECLLLTRRDSVVGLDRCAGDVLDYEDTFETERMRSALKAYKRLLKRTFIDVARLERPMIQVGRAGARHIAISQFDKDVCRIFSEGTWDRDGRFYGGWWQRAPSQWRSKIWIDDEPCVVEDCSSFYLLMLYAELGLSYLDGTSDQPFDVWCEQAEDAAEARSWTKNLILSMLKTHSEQAACRAFRSSQDFGSRGRVLSDVDLAGLMDRIRAKHRLVAHLLTESSGLRLENREALIQERIIGSFTNMGIPILIAGHEYIIPSRYRPVFREIMRYTLGKVLDLNLEHEKENRPDGLGFAELLEKEDWSAARKAADGNVQRGSVFTFRKLERTRGYISRYEKFCSWRNREN